ncbi:MAG TPA: class I SAM-dependent methyltransferase [Longimicrobium sp.]|nr:class I SAM-dependent methyltransferase [Longimicrobium sp.]
MSADTPFSYDSIADAYAAGIDAAPYNALYERPAMLSLLPDLAGARVLDAGCGAGWYTEQLLARGARVTSIDQSGEMIRHARARLGDAAELRVHDLSHPLAFAQDASYDGILSPLTLHYLRDWSTPLAEFRRILKPGGWLLFSTHHPAADAALFQPERYLDVEPVEDEWKWVGTVRFYRRPLCEIINPLAQARFAIERLVEPIPTDEFRQAKPEAYARVLRQPNFLIILARPLIR